MHIALDSTYGTFLTLARIGTALSLMPGFGEAFVPGKVRALLAVMICLCLGPIVQDMVTIPKDMAHYLPMILSEMVVGGLLGLLVRLFTITLETSGAIISFQAGLSAATAFNPTMDQQGSLISSILMMAGLVLIFTFNVHHLFITGIVQSYELFPAGDLPDISSMNEALVDLLARSFIVAIQLSAPFLVINLLFVFGVGLINRLMPQLQLFFVSMPVQILIGLLMFALTVASILAWYMDALQGAFAYIFQAL